MQDRAYEVALNPKYDGYERRLTSMTGKFFDDKTGSEVIATSKMVVNINEMLFQKLQKPITKKLKKRKVYPKFKDNI